MKTLILLLSCAAAWAQAPFGSITQPSSNGIPAYGGTGSPAGAACTGNQQVTYTLPTTPYTTTIYTCGGGGVANQFGVAPAGSTTLGGTQTYAGGPSANNNVQTVAVGSSVTRTQNDKNNDTLSLKDFVNTQAAGYIPMTLSVQAPNDAVSYCTANGTTLFTCSQGTSWTSANAVSPHNNIVIFQKNSANYFQTTISSVNSGGSVNLAAAVPFSGTGLFAYYGDDDSAGANAWITQLIAQNKCGYIPSLRNVANASTNGTSGFGLINVTAATGWAHPCFVGDSMTESIVYLGVPGNSGGQSLIDDISFWNSLKLMDFTIYMGFAQVRNKYTSNNVTNGTQAIVERMGFMNYSASGFSLNSSDFTYGRFEHNKGYGLSSATSIAMAIAEPDQWTIAHNAFINNLVNEKLGVAGLGAKSFDNDNIQFYPPTQTTGRAATWLVPATSAGAVGYQSNWDKFGNEYLDAGDYRYLFADSNANSGNNYFGETTWKTTASTGYIPQVVLNDKLVGGDNSAVGTGVNPMIYSYTPNISGSILSGELLGTMPGYLMQFDSGITQTNQSSQGNICGTFSFPAAGGANGLSISNWKNVCKVLDPQGLLAYADPTVLSPWSKGAGIGGAVNLNPRTLGSLGITGGGSIAGCTDSYGGSNCATITTGTSGTGNLFFGPLGSTPTIGQQNYCWVDIQQGASNPLAQIVFEIADNTNSPIAYSSGNITISSFSGLTHYTFPWVLSVALTNNPPHYIFTTTSVATTGQTAILENLGCSTSQDAPSGNWSPYPLTIAGSTSGNAIINATPTGGGTVIPNSGALSVPGLTLAGVWPTTGTSTTTKPMLLIEPSGTTSTGWATTATGLGINAAVSGNVIDAQLNGSSVWKTTTTGNTTQAGGVIIGSSNYYQVNSKGGFTMSANGVMELVNTALNNFTRLQFGGTSTSFGAICSSGATLSICLGDGTYGGIWSTPQLTVTATGSTSSTPALMGFPVLTTGQEVEIPLGSAGDLLLDGYGNDLQLGAYNGIELKGRDAGTAPTPGTTGCAGATCVYGGSGNTVDILDLYPNTGTTRSAFFNSVGGLSVPTLSTITNCSSSASPAVCGAAPAGSFVVAAAATSVVVNTTAVTANSQIFVIEDASLGTKLGVTCNTADTIAADAPRVTARTAGTSFTVSVTGTVATNPACYSYFISN